MKEPILLHTPEPLPDVSVVQPFWQRFPERKGSILFNKKLPQNFFDYGVSFVEPENAKAIILPHSFSTVNSKEAAYIAKYADLGEKLKIPVFIFSLGDLNDYVRFDPRVYVFRQSVYRSTMQVQDIVMPTLTEDNAEEEITLRQKQAVPTVSFCGQGGYQTFKQQIKYHIKVWQWKFAGFVNPTSKARIIGVYWRKKMMQACERSTLVKTLFIVRRSFSGAHRTIELDPAQARKEFIDSILNSDFVLAPKGDGNYSNRFLEALSFGRIPVLLDTDTVLPLEGYIDYESIMVRIPMGKVRNTPKSVRAWYDAHGAAQWETAQHKAREAFATKLRFDSFFEYFFTRVLPQLPVIPNYL